MWGLDGDLCDICVFGLRCSTGSVETVKVARNVLGPDSDETFVELKGRGGVSNDWPAMWAEGVTADEGWESVCWYRAFPKSCASIHSPNYSQRCL